MKITKIILHVENNPQAAEDMTAVIEAVMAGFGSLAAVRAADVVKAAAGCPHAAARVYQQVAAAVDEDEDTRGPVEMHSGVRIVVPPGIRRNTPGEVLLTTPMSETTIRVVGLPTDDHFRFALCVRFPPSVYTTEEWVHAPAQDGSEATGPRDGSRVRAREMLERIAAANCGAAARLRCYARCQDGKCVVLTGVATALAPMRADQEEILRTCGGIVQAMR